MSSAYIPIDGEECDAVCESNIKQREFYHERLRDQFLVRYFFNLGYGLMGIGSMPTFTFAISYIWENNKYRNVEKF